MEYDSLCQVNNNGDTPVRFSLHSQRFNVPARGVAYVPFDAIVNRLGDPRSGPQAVIIPPQEPGQRTKRIPSRNDELKRLAAKYGVYDTTDKSLLLFRELKDENDTRANLMPNVTVTNINEDEPFVFPLDDPHCEMFTPPAGDTSQLAIIQRQLEKQRRVIAMLEQQANAGKVAATVNVSADEIEEDKPQRVNIPPRR